MEGAWNKVQNFLSCFNPLVSCGNSNSSRSKSIGFYTKSVNGYLAEVVVINLQDRSIIIKPEVARNKHKNPRYPRETFDSFINRAKPDAAINGTYYDTITYKPVTTIIVDGKAKYKGNVGTLVTFTRDGDIKFYRPNEAKKSLFKHAIRTGPTLIYNNKICLIPKKEGFRDPNVLGPAARSMLGLTNNGKLLLITIKKPISLKKAAEIMKKLNCKYAVCLDGGSSSALYYKGKYLTKTKRALTNFLAVYQVKQDKNQYGFLYEFFYKK